MSSSRPRLRVVSVTRKPLTEEKVPALKLIFRLAALPLAPTKVVLEIENVSTEVVNALRRVVTDEIEGYSLTISGFAPETTDVHMLPPFVSDRISALRLQRSLAADAGAIRLALDVTNTSPVQRSVFAGDLTVSAGKLGGALFNPTAEIAFLQPGKRLVIRDIRIDRGVGRENARFNVVCQGAYSHLDLPQHSDEDLRREGGAAVDLSSYKTSCLVANPRHHQLRGVVPATATDGMAESLSIYSAACINIIGRLRMAGRAVEGGSAGVSTFSSVRLAGGLSEGILRAPGETQTIGALLSRAVHEGTPDVAFVASVCSPDLTLTVRHAGADARDVLSAAIKSTIGVFEILNRDLLAAMK